MTTQEIEEKALDLVAPIIGQARAASLVATIAQLEKVRTVREIRPLLRT